MLFLREYASYIKDAMVAELTDLNRNLMLSIDVVPFSNYIFMMGYTGNDGVADETKFNKLTANFALNMKLLECYHMCYVPCFYSPCNALFALTF